MGVYVKTKKDLLIENEILKSTLECIEKELKKEQSKTLTDEIVKHEIIKISKIKPKQPRWSLSSTCDRSQVLPSVQLSDLHFGETVHKDQIFGINEYNISIAQDRLRIFTENTCSLLRDVIALDYPGIVLNLNGDMLSGDIHDELTATNDAPVMPSFLSLFDSMIEVIHALRSEFKQVLVTATAGGNHSRTTKKVPSKGKAYSNYDWLLYRMLEKSFGKDENVTFLISDGDDLEFSLYGHRYRQTHGDAFRGGHGFIGPFAPITRSETKKRTAAASYGRPYDTLIIGHFHQLMFMGSTIVNGSLVGYNEFAMKINSPFDYPKQALWLTHYKYGITGQYPIFCCDVDKKQQEVATWPIIKK